MNKERRAKIDKALSQVEEIAAVIREAASKERDYYENMPENMQSGERGENASADADKLDEWADEWADELEAMQPTELDH